MNRVLSQKQFRLSRRRFMIGAAGLSFAFAFGNRPAEAAIPAGASAGKALTPWASIEPDGTIYIMSPATEMGQGSMTSLPLIVAEESMPTGARCGRAGAGDREDLWQSRLRRDDVHRRQQRGAIYFTPLRTFGAQVRHVLLDNAAKHWNVPLAELSTEPSMVVHAKSTANIGYGEIAAFAEAAGERSRGEAGSAQEDERFSVDRQRRVACRTAKQDQWQRAIFDRRAGARNDLRHGRAQPGRGRHSQIVRRSQGEGDPGRPRYRAVCLTASASSRTPRGPPLQARRRSSVRSPGIVTGTRVGLRQRQGHGSLRPRREKPGRSGHKGLVQTGRRDSELAKAATTVEAEYRCDYAYHAQMEPLNAVASVSPDGDSCRNVVRHAKPDDGDRSAGKSAGHSARQGDAALHAVGRRLRSARPSRRGIHRRRGAVVEGGRQTGQDDVDARGRCSQRPPAPDHRASLCVPGWTPPGSSSLGTSGSPATA